MDDFGDRTRSASAPTDFRCVLAGQDRPARVHTALDRAAVVQVRGLTGAVPVGGGGRLQLPERKTSRERGRNTMTNSSCEGSPTGTGPWTGRTDSGCAHRTSAASASSSGTSSVTPTISPSVAKRWSRLSSASAIVGPEGSALSRQHGCEQQQQRRPAAAHRAFRGRRQRRQHRGGQMTTQARALQAVVNGVPTRPSDESDW